MVLILDLLFNAIYILMIVRIIISFARVSPYHPTWGGVVQFVYNVTEPLLAPVRRILPPMMGLDFSPMIVLIAASILRRILIQILIGL